VDNSSAVNVARSGEEDEHRRWATVGTAAGGAKASVAAGRAAASVMADVRDFIVAVLDATKMRMCQDRKWRSEADSDFFIFNVERGGGIGRKKIEVSCTTTTYSSPPSNGAE
jgi:hypothetical protein